MSARRELTPVPEPGASTNPLDFLFATKTLSVNGHDFTFKELSVKESDSALDGAKREDGSIDGRLNMRLLIAKSAVEPKIGVDDIAKMPNRVYIKFAEFVNDLNSIDDAEEPKDEGEGNA